MECYEFDGYPAKTLRKSTYYSGSVCRMRADQSDVKARVFRRVLIGLHVLGFVKSMFSRHQKRLCAKTRSNCTRKPKTFYPIQLIYLVSSYTGRSISLWTIRVIAHVGK